MALGVGNRKLKDFDGRKRLEEDLYRLVQSETLDFSRPISTETELAGTYDISRNTVRKALQSLANEGLLYKRHGLGTFVVPPEERSPKHISLNKILLMIPDYGGNPADMSQYDRKLFGGVADYAFLNNAQLEIRAYTDSKAKLVDQFRNLKFDGIIWERPPADYYEVIEELRRQRVPQVTISRQVAGVPALFFDYEAGVREVVRFLCGIGHREIIFLDLDRPEPIFVKRRKFFQEELQRNGVADSAKHVYLSPFKELTEKQLEGIFAAHPDLTAIFFSVVLFPELYEYLRKRKIKIPGDLSLISLEENEMSREQENLSSLREPRQQLGRRAAELIRLQKTRGAVPVELEYIPGELLIRGSCLSPCHILEKTT
jgi:DNA-binding LacI/PurR family transcriptional regulator